jgi:IS5 family transposase
MRKKFEVQYELGATPVEKLRLPLKSRDELPPVLRALQHIFSTPELNSQVFALLEKKIMANVKKTGRNGMSLWEILVFSVVRLALDANFDRLEHTVNYDILVRSFVGIPSFGENLKQYSLQSLKDNVQLLDDQTLDEINQLVVGSGHSLKKNENLDVHVDSYVLETNVHFPTDLNLLHDAGRKSIKLVGQLSRAFALAGWRKYKDWRKRLKRAYHKAAKANRGKAKHSEKAIAAVSEYLSIAEELSEKLNESIDWLVCEPTILACYRIIFNKLTYFKEHLDKHIDLVRRRLIWGESIPHAEKVFSLFEPYTEWIKKGKIRNEVELGLRIAIATDQRGFVLDYRVMQNEQDVDITVPLSLRLLGRYSINSLSFDKGFWSPQNYNQLQGLVANLIMPRKGKLSQSDKEREYTKSFQKFRRQHAAVESAINCLEHHGLNRCPDKGLTGFKRYTAIGILAYNLHKLCNILLEEDRAELSKNEKIKKAA